MTRVAGTMTICDDIRDQMRSRERSKVNPAQIACYLLSGCFDGKYLDSETSCSRQNWRQGWGGWWIAADRWLGPYHKAVVQGQDSRG